MDALKKIDQPVYVRYPFFSGLFVFLLCIVHFLIEEMIYMWGILFLSVHAFMHVLTVFLNYVVALQ